MGMTLLVFAGGGNLPGFEHASQSRCLRVCNRGCRLTWSTKSSTTCACAVSFRSARIGRRSRVRTGTSTSSCVKAPTRLATSGSSPSSWSAFASSGNGSGTSTSCSPASSLSRSGRCLARGRASSRRATLHGGRAKPGSTSHRVAAQRSLPAPAKVRVDTPTSSLSLSLSGRLVSGDRTALRRTRSLSSRGFRPLRRNTRPSTLSRGIARGTYRRRAQRYRRLPL